MTQSRFWKPNVVRPGTVLPLNGRKTESLFSWCALSLVCHDSPFRLMPGLDSPLSGLDLHTRKKLISSSRACCIDFDTCCLPSGGASKNYRCQVPVLFKCPKYHF
ncbi:hypothetical protein CRENBAI_023579 [Crenichthys baileyi]|uniref:Uncharacterized protein n=1 Tax=Crenichthys baileyi TaxID=28760 RepID=A0AAV9QVP8_9TELE